ncbi:MAG: YkgJ family cysteine cluster protein [Thermodesulfobacteriota bacterium]|nr:YkgJ family cysteine cluster protein [Thermodesulfobacteriota bacterium]
MTDLKSINIKQNARITECIRCGTCCKKGGPSFHLADKPLIDKGIILSKHLFTIRKGELAYDNVRQELLPLSSELIKIKGKNDSSTCIFFNESEKKCEIYKNRPVECKALKCWDTREIEKIYSKDRLTRKDLLFNIEGLWELVKDHQSRCSYEKIKKMLQKQDNSKNAIQKEISEIIRYDTQIRHLVVKKGGMDSEILDFLFGRPLTVTIKSFGFAYSSGNSSSTKSSISSMGSSISSKASDIDSSSDSSTGSIS